MKKWILTMLFLLAGIVFASAMEWKAKWITPMVNQNQPNTWIGFRKQVSVAHLPAEAIAHIAVDSKYWLWINGDIVVHEGGLKRGPNRTDTYYDEVDIAPYLHEGDNTIAILVWYFGKDSFSHNSSGKAGLLFDCRAPGVEILSDVSWGGSLIDAFSTAPAPTPNFRLSESSIRYDGRRDPKGWQTNHDIHLGECIEIREAGEAPWNKLHKRPIPLWKDYGLADYVAIEEKIGETHDMLICTLPYNAHVTPWLKTDAAEGQLIEIYTDNYLKFTGEYNLRAEYVTGKGPQEFECYGWMNGHKVYYVYPHGMKRPEVKYRESGYNAEFAGEFHCSDPFFEKLWTKAARTLYVNMRDTYMDCPERERAQWTGDAVNEAEQAYYALSRSADGLTRKWLREIVGWQKPNGQLFAPVPAGNWTKELSGQVLSTIGYFGLWNYYMQTGDRETLADLYDGVKRYLSLWQTEPDGTVVFRHGEWQWGDWGSNVDIVAVHNILFYHAIKGMQQAAQTLGKTNDAWIWAEWMKNFEKGFNARFWNGKAYRTPDYNGATDDRVQALAAVIGVAGPDKYPAIVETLHKEYHASPYMERYVMEALFVMGYPEFALERIRQRFEPMVKDDRYTTLYEGWDDGATVNHAWSGGALNILSRYLCGVAPVEPAYRTFQIAPQPGNIDRASTVVPSIAGTIRSSFEQTSKRFTLKISVPENTTCIVCIERKYAKIALGGKRIWQQGRFIPHGSYGTTAQDNDAFIKFTVGAGDWTITADK